jgi:hypothetical protein
MKNNINSVIYPSFVSCQSDDAYENLNRDPKNQLKLMQRFYTTMQQKFSWSNDKYQCKH